jgi:hypothetical protein
MMKIKLIKISLILTHLFLICPTMGANVTNITYLTFNNQDTSSHVVVNFITEGRSTTSTVYFDTIDHGLKKEKYRNSQVTSVDTISGIDRSYHHSVLGGLKPNTTYYFLYGDEAIGLSSRYIFKTLPSDDSQIRLVVGGDMSASEKIIENAKDSMKIKPHAIIIGGDIAYANGRIRNELRWIQWFEKMNQIMLGQNNLLTPLILAIGNHETSLGSASPFNRAPFFFKLFPQREQKSYFSLKLGSELGMVVLDTGHMFKHKDQNQFLEKTLKDFSSLKHKIAVYHAPLYPNHRKYNDRRAARGRKNWQPLFDQYNLDLAFEHHDHTLKRTKVIKGDKVSKKGTLYVGDGCWGKDSRSSNQRWYLEKASSTTHVWQAIIDKQKIKLKAMGKDAQVYDHLTLTQEKDQTIVTEHPLN